VDIPVPRNGIRIIPGGGAWHIIVYGRGSLLVQEREGNPQVPGAGDMAAAHGAAGSRSFGQPGPVAQPSAPDGMRRALAARPCSPGLLPFSHPLFPARPSLNRRRPMACAAREPLPSLPCFCTITPIPPSPFLAQERAPCSDLGGFTRLLSTPGGAPDGLMTEIPTILTKQLSHGRCDTCDHGFVVRRIVFGKGKASIFLEGRVF
jgi:hypothetical protein